MANIPDKYDSAQDMRSLTSQEKAYVQYVTQGMSKIAASRAAGYRSVPEGQNIQAAIDLIHERSLGEIIVTRDGLNRMLFEAHAKAATSTEEIAAIRELGKLNGLYEQTDTGSAVDIQNVKQLESMDDSQLIELAEYEVLEELDP